MSTLQDKFDQLINDQKELKLKFQTEAQALFKDITREFFDKNPGITAVIWTQCTPYFNDGDTCEFSVNDPYFTNVPGEELENVSACGEYEGEDESVWVLESYAFTSDSDWCKSEREKVSGVDFESIKSFTKMICCSEMEDVMESMFDDHVKVIATREGFEVDDYHHD
jgi:hypothetical protein